MDSAVDPCRESRLEEANAEVMHYIDTGWGSSLLHPLGPKTQNEDLQRQLFQLQSEQSNRASTFEERVSTLRNAYEVQFCG